MATKSLAPNAWATGMAKPLHAPLQKPIIKNMIEADAPTAASAPTLTKRPTMAASIMRYICCRM